MTHRERVVRAINHQEPDRIPIDMMGNATMLADQTYFDLCDYLGITPGRPFRNGSTANYYDERILEHFDVDFRRVFLAQARDNNTSPHENGSFSDIWDIRYKKEGNYVNIVGNPLIDVESPAAIDEYPWPQAHDMFSARGLAQIAETLYEQGDYAIVARNPLTEGFIDRAVQLMGMSDFLVALAAKPRTARRLLKHLLDIYKDVYGMFLDAVGPYVQIVETGDDIGTQESLLISPEMYREFIKPLELELYALIHEKAPHASLFRHVDGAIFELIPDLIDVGVDILNPVQTSAKGMDASKLKKAYGSLTFHGGIEKMACPVDQLIAEIKEKIDILAPGGGYIFASCNHIINVRPGNIEAMFKTAREYGRYAK